MWYVIARMKEETKEMAYHIYVTDALKMIAENTAKFAGGKYLKERFADQIFPRDKNKPKQGESGKEIADNLIKGLTSQGG